VLEKTRSLKLVFLQFMLSEEQRDARTA